MKNRILIIDFWTKAIPAGQITPIYDQLDKDEYEFVLLHFASIAGHKEKQFQEIEGIPCYDCSTFSKINIKKALQKLNPDIILILNHSDLMDRAVLKVGKKLKIPVFFFQHGFLITHLGKEGHKEFIGNIYTFRKYLKQLKKYIYFFVNYLLASQFVDKFYIFKKEFYMFMFYALINPVKFLYYLPASKLTCPDLSFVYGEKDKYFLMKTYNYSESSIVVGGSMLFEGYLDVVVKDDDGKEARNWIRNKGLDIDKKTVLFLPSIKVEAGIHGSNREVFKQMLKTVCLSGINRGFNLIVKLHQHADEGLYEDLKGMEGVWLIRNSNLLELVGKSDLIIIEPTSTAVIPCILFKKPIIHLQLIPDARLGFDYSKHGIGVVCRDEQGLNELLEKSNSFGDLVDYDAYDVFEKEFCNYRNIKTSRLIADHIRTQIPMATANN